MQPAEPALVAETDLDYVPISRTAAQNSVKRKTVLPICLFFATCLSTFWVGVSLWNPNFFEPFYRAISNPGVQQGSLLEIRQMLLSNWDTGLIYMLCVMLILFMHEMGHFIATLIYRVPASYPFFLPFPANPIGTLGAVIGMQGALADRKQIFDIGIAGPLVGLVAAVPIAYFGVSQLDLTGQPYGGFGFRLPVLLDWFAKVTEVPRLRDRRCCLDESVEPPVCRWLGRHANHGAQYDADWPVGWRTHHVYLIW